jgi:hypothetical protein
MVARAAAATVWPASQVTIRFFMWPANGAGSTGRPTLVSLGRTWTDMCRRRLGMSKSIQRMPTRFTPPPSMTDALPATSSPVSRLVPMGAQPGLTRPRHTQIPLSKVPPMTTLPKLVSDAPTEMIVPSPQLLESGYARIRPTISSSGPPAVSPLAATEALPGNSGIRTQPTASAMLRGFGTWRCREAARPVRELWISAATKGTFAQLMAA